jgi:hypothetical protein
MPRLSQSSYGLLATWLLLLPTISIAGGLDVGKRAPFFSIKSGDYQNLTLDTVKGKIVVIIYESKDVVEVNRELKEELKEFYDLQPDGIKEQIVRLPIVNCSGAFWPFTKIWKKKLRDNSKKEGITIYGDWSGKMFSDYGMKGSDSNILIIGRNGRVRYFTSGKLESEDIAGIKNLLKRLANE